MSTASDLQEVERLLSQLPPSFQRTLALERVRDLTAQQQCHLWWPLGPYRVRVPRPGER